MTLGLVCARPPSRLVLHVTYVDVWHRPPHESRQGLGQHGPRHSYTAIQRYTALYTIQRYTALYTIQLYSAIHYLYNLYNTPLDRPFPSVDRCSSSQGFGIEAGL